MTINRYKLSFTTGSLYHKEAIKAAAQYFLIKDWIAVRRGIIINNEFQTRTTASSKRITQELLPRLINLSDEQLWFLLNGSRQEQNHILWLSVCQQYQFIREFAVEVIREKVYHLDLSISHADFDAFMNSKSEWHEELGNLTDHTRNKLRRVLFQMLREAGILSETNEILQTLPSPRVARSIRAADADLCAVFPIHESDFIRQAAL
jgi:hypothetical protein